MIGILFMAITDSASNNWTNLCTSQLPKCWWSRLATIKGYSSIPSSLGLGLKPSIDGIIYGSFQTTMSTDLLHSPLGNTPKKKKKLWVFCNYHFPPPPPHLGNILSSFLSKTWLDNFIVTRYFFLLFYIVNSI